MGCAEVAVPTPRKFAGRLKYRPTATIDAEILRAYLQQRQGDKQALGRVSASLGWPSWAIARRGAQLGVTRAKEAAWSREEEELLEKAGHLTCAAIQIHFRRAGYNRSCAAIQMKLNRLRIKQNLDGYSANGLAAAFGVDVHKVLTWISRRLLEAERRGTERTIQQGGDTWWITHSAVKRFVLRAPEEIDLARVEKLWFLDLLTDGRICR